METKIIDKQISFSAPGKIMLSGEYAVLLGAKAIVLSTRQRQFLRARQEYSETLVWKSSYNNVIFFQGIYNWDKERFLTFSNSEKAFYLQKLLRACVTLNPRIKYSISEIHSRLEFSPEWGLGSSASLIVNLARLFNLNPINLNILISRGSGADISCAIAETPIFFHKEKGKYISEPFVLNFPFRNHLWFVYLGKKQFTEHEVIRSLKTTYFSNHELEEITFLSEKMAATFSLDEFEEIIHKHEALISQHIRIPTLHQTLFYDFEGTVKSLGAWGGDMALLVWKGEKEYLMNYLKQKNINSLFSFNELISDGSISNL